MCQLESAGLPVQCDQHVQSLKEGFQLSDRMDLTPPALLHSRACFKTFRLKFFTESLGETGIPFLTQIIQGAG